MNEVFVYVIKVNLIISLCFLFYWLLLRKENFFTLNRLILLGAIIVGFVLPLLPGTALFGLQEKVVAPFRESFTKEALSDISMPAAETEFQTSKPGAELTIPPNPATSQERSSSFTLVQVITLVYLLIAIILFIRFIFQLIHVFKLLKGNETRTIDGIIYHSTEKPLPPFSFFHHLVINSTHSGLELEQIIAHEKVHIRQWHMLDILLINLLQIVFWFNPVIWMMNRIIKLNLEYIADEAVLNSGVDRKAYQVNILSNCLNPADYELVNLFTSSKIKLRIKMMNANKSPQSRLYKYVLILPLLLTTYFFMNPVSAKPSNKIQASALLQSQNVSSEFAKETGEPVDTLKNRKKYEIVSINTTNKRMQMTIIDDKGKKYQLNKVNERVKELYVDNVRIPESGMSLYSAFFEEVNQLQKDYEEKVQKKLSLVKVHTKEIDKQLDVKKGKAEKKREQAGASYIDGIDQQQLSLTKERKSDIQTQSGNQQPRQNQMQEKSTELQEKLEDVQKGIEMLNHQTEDKKRETGKSTAQRLKQIEDDMAKTQQTIFLIITELRKENVIGRGKKLSFTLDDKQLVVNGKIQSDELHNRLKMYLTKGKPITYSRTGL